MIQLLLGHLCFAVLIYYAAAVAFGIFCIIAMGPLKGGHAGLNFLSDLIFIFFMIPFTLIPKIVISFIKRKVLR